MDGVFGRRSFRNEIIWCYAGGGVPKYDFPRKHDVILRYSRDRQYYYKPIYRPYSEGTLQRGRTPVKGKYYKRGLRKEGTPVNDWWVDVPKITSPTDPEKLGYPTQKPLALLNRVIESSSQEGDTVLDPFCGCGTSVHAAQNLQRRWIGIDICVNACEVIEKRLRSHFDSLWDRVEFIGMPKTRDDAKTLADLDKFRFERWAASLVDGMEANARRQGNRRSRSYPHSQGRVHRRRLPGQGGRHRPGRRAGVQQRAPGGRRRYRHLHLLR
ncbi:MAG: site-specific DNA-methyltransferase [Defluviicoccus sp.]|nr:site-specific DNA-methyltransferase [Defluviicoccus sp.]